MPAQAKIMLFGTSSCSWCRRAQSYFREKHLKFRYIDVAKDERAALDIQRKTGQSGVPVIMINGKYVVGFDVAKINRLLGIK